MIRHFNTHLEGLDLDFWHDLIKSRGRLVSLKKGEYICCKGEPTNIVGYLVSGYLIYSVDGYNHIGGFTFPDALFGDYPSCMNDSPAMFDITVGKNGEAWVMDSTVLPELYEEDKVICRQGRLFMESAYTSLAQRYYSLCAKTPLERYVELITEHPQVEQTVSQKEIAMYLQITPTHLARIRKELLRQNIQLPINLV